MPSNDSPFWPILKDTIRLVFAIVAGCMIYNTVDFAKDFKFIVAIALGNGLITGVTGAIRKRIDHDKSEP